MAKAADAAGRGEDSTAMKEFRVTLRVGILGMFMLIMLPLTLGLVVVLHVRNSVLAAETAGATMTRVSNDSLAVTRELFAPILQTLDISSALGEGLGEDVRQPRYWQSPFQALLDLPFAYTLYFGFERDGGFLQIVRLPKDVAQYSIYGRPPPPTARYAVRQIAAVDGVMTDQLTFFEAWNRQVGTDRADRITYDPRARPWYRDAAGSAGPHNSGAYAFAGVKTVGVTLSQRMMDPAGGLLGVFGVDVTLDTLSQSLARAELGPHGVAFILDGDGHVVAQSGTQEMAAPVSARSGLVRFDQVADPRIRGATRIREQMRSDSFTAPLDSPGRVYRVTFTSLPPAYGPGWRVGVVVTDDDFIGDFNRFRNETAVAGIVFILLACGAIAAASLLISRPINRLIAETDAIRQFELAGGVKVDSPITEIHALARALGDMKSALRSFGRFVPREVVKEIVQDRASAMLGGVRQPLTVMFSDLAKFSLASENLPPEEVVERLSRYFEAMAKPIHRHNGVIDKFIGDSIMALWNAPTADGDHVAHACLAALGCRAMGERLNAGFAEAGIPPMRTRFGLHTGLAVVGKVGSANRMQFTALGATINLASRIEGINKQFGTELLVTGDVERAVHDRFLFRPLGQVVAAGTTLAVPIFELLGTREDADADLGERLDRWNQAMAAFEARDWAQASTAFAAFLDAHPEDEAAAVYRTLCARLVLSDAGWDGAFHLDSK